MRAGVQKRFTMKPPDSDPIVMARFRDFVKDWISKNLVPLPVDTDVSVDSWLDATNYPLWRRQALKRTNDGIINRRDRQMFVVKSFMKDEKYPSYKHARAINSRTDEFKTLVGPVFKCIEKEVFKLDWFIKKVPIHLRPTYIFERLGSTGPYLATDHTAFEAHFTRELMRSCEFQLYRYMTQRLSCHEEFMYYVEHVIGGRNKCKFKHFDVEVDATRMSGEMNTSLGNGFSNLMFMLFYCSENHCTNVNGVVEGDDGLFSMEGTPPSEHQFLSLGLTLKLETHVRLNTASFCGLVFDPDDLVNVTNPIIEVVDFGWTTARYAECRRTRHLELLKCKSYSLAYQYSGCPVLTAIASYGLRMTRNVRARPPVMSMWEREQWDMMVNADIIKRGALRSPPMNTRLLVEELYGLPVEIQIRLEDYFNNLTELVPIPYDVIAHLCSPVWSNYAARYTKHK